MKSIILAIGVLFFVGPTFADTISCNNFENATYEGNKKGKGYQGPITIKFTDQCKSTKSGFKIKYKWIGSNGKVVTPGALTFKEEDEVKYKNKAGSKGKVFIEGDKLHWKNVYTGNNYNVHVTKQQ
tara:strand:+ start:76 stop:453 length:378 start_codon:yes stop_codon:yes gene_type:complete